jgi:hypothetical protein
MKSGWINRVFPAGFVEEQAFAVGTITGLLFL